MGVPENEPPWGPGAVKFVEGLAVSAGAVLSKSPPAIDRELMEPCVADWVREPEKENVVPSTVTVPVNG